MAAGLFLVLHTFQENVTFYFTPSEIQTNNNQQPMRLGGLVLENSIVRDPEGLAVRFVVHDFNCQVPVLYKGLLPDLFKEGKGIVVSGKMQNGFFVADDVLAKHDENYRPPKISVDRLDKSLAHGLV